jgi:chromatin modification-related protein EAF6
METTASSSDGADGAGVRQSLAPHAAGVGRKRSASATGKITTLEQATAAQKRPRKKSGGDGRGAEAMEGARARAQELVERREATERSLATLEQQIYALETSYLEDTHSRGNILSGWGSYLSRRGAVSQRKPHFSNKHRVFSLSSTTALHANGQSSGVGKLDRGDDDDSGRDDDAEEEEDEDEDGANGDRLEEEPKKEKKVVRRRRTDSYKLE